MDTMRKLTDAQESALDYIWAVKTGDGIHRNTLRSLAARGLYSDVTDDLTPAGRLAVPPGGWCLDCTSVVSILGNGTVRRHTRAATPPELVTRGQRRVHCHGSGKRSLARR